VPFYYNFEDAADGGLCLARQVVKWLQLSLPSISARGNSLEEDET